MNEQRRLILTILVATAFMWIWMEFLGPKPAKRTESVRPQPTQATTSVIATTVPSAAPKQAQKPIEKATQFKQKSELFDASWSTASAIPTKITLSKYQTIEDHRPIQILPFLTGTDKPSLLWSFDVDGEVFTDEGANYTLVAQDSQKVVFERNLTSDLQVQKSYAWNKEGYSFDLTTALTNKSSRLRKIKAATEATISFASNSTPSMFNPGDPMAITAYVNDKSVRLHANDLAKAKSIPVGDIRWAGGGSRYFLFSLIPVEAKWNEIKATAEWKDPAAKQDAENLKDALVQYFYPGRDLRGNETQKYTVRVYVGPKDIEMLEKADPTLNRAIDFGDWLGHISRPIHNLLNFLYSIVPNYGIAIILLTVLVRLLLFPMVQMQSKSMKRMQEHQPEMNAIREKYKDQKEVQSRELMNYMRKHKINPAGGCLLLLPQLPIFFSLYRVIGNSIELRQAPFFGWIRDLSSYDPYYILPALLGVVMYFQQKIMPTPGVDPSQQKMMKFTTFLFPLLMLRLPAGLNLYIFVSTLWGIGQQLWVKRSSPNKGVQNFDMERSAK